MHGLLGELFLLVAMATVGVVLFERLRLPAVAGFLVMGALVGPGALGLVSDPERVRELAELGVVFLLFEIGLELPMERLRRMWRHALLAGGVQVAATLAVAAAITEALGVEPRAALMMGALVAMSSTAVVLRLLSERSEVDSPQGQVAVGILLFQDLCVVPLLLLVPVLAARDPGAMQDAVVALVRSGAALVIFFVGARFLLPPLLDRLTRLRSPDLFGLVAIVLVLGSALVAERLGLTLAVGAFLGGLVVSASPWAHQLFAEIVPLRGVFLGLFFTAIGMLLDPRAALAAVDAVALYAAGVMVGKAAIIAAIVAGLLRLGWRLGIVAGLTLAQTGEFSFVLAAVAVDQGVLDPGLYQVFVAGSVLTLLATPFLMDVAPRVADLLGERIEAGAVSPRRLVARAEAEHAMGTTVLVGFGLANQQAARVLRALGRPYVAVEANAARVREAVAAGEPVVFGDATRRALLDRLGVARARLVVVAVSDPVTTRRVVRLARLLAPEVPIVARTRYVAEVDAVQEAGATTVLADEFEAAIALLAEVMRAHGMPDDAIARFTAELREEGYEPLRAPVSLALDPWLLELLEPLDTRWVEVPDTFGPEASLAELEVRARTGATVLAVDRGGRVSPNPPADFRVRPGDRLLVVGSPEAVQRLCQLLGGEGPAAPSEPARL